MPPCAAPPSRNLTCCTLGTESTLDRSVVVCCLSFSKAGSASQEALSRSRLRGVYYNCPPQPSALWQCGCTRLRQGDSKAGVKTMVSLRTAGEANGFQQRELVYPSVKTPAPGMRSWKLMCERPSEELQPTAPMGLPSLVSVRCCKCPMSCYNLMLASCHSLFPFYF